MLRRMATRINALWRVATRMDSSTIRVAIGSAAWGVATRMVLKSIRIAIQCPLGHYGYTHSTKVHACSHPAGGGQQIFPQKPKNNRSRARVCAYDK